MSKKKKEKTWECPICGQKNTNNVQSEECSKCKSPLGARKYCLTMQILSNDGV